MKFRLSSILLTLILFLFIGCTKEISKEGETGPGPATGDFYATIGGTTWNADSVQLVLISAAGVSINGISKIGDRPHPIDRGFVIAEIAQIAGDPRLNRIKVACE